MPSSLSPFPPSLPTPSLLMVPAMALKVPCRKPPLLLDFTQHLTLVWWHFRKSCIITTYLAHFPSRQNSRMTPLPPPHTPRFSPPGVCTLHYTMITLLLNDYVTWDGRGIVQMLIKSFSRSSSARRISWVPNVRETERVSCWSWATKLLSLLCWGPHAEPQWEASKTCKQSLDISKQWELPVLQRQRTEFWRHGCPNWHLNFSLVRPWAEDPGSECLDTWSPENGT